MPLLLVFAALLLAFAAYLVGEVVTAPSRQRRTAVQRAATYGRVRAASTGLERLHFRERVIAPATASLARFALRLNPRMTAENISFRLMAAGMGRTVTPTTFLAAKGAGLVFGALLGFVFGIALGGAKAGFLLALGCLLDRLRHSGLRTSRVVPRHVARRSGPSCRTRSTCSPSPSRPVSGSTARSPS